MKKIFIIRLLAAGVIFIGCALTNGTVVASGQDASNRKTYLLHRPSCQSDSETRGILLLLAFKEPRADLGSGCEMLEPVLQTELIKTKKFRGDPGQLHEMLRQPHRTIELDGAQEIFANGFFRFAATWVYGCDAALFLPVNGISRPLRAAGGRLAG